ncbi:hypothetical protein U9M48_008571 [Paspalum notatum var. saurae]|uniref:Uncharacterized protein n=1 Tax=Paspalum notatum var. saurae TaxID=547442 RepID=A0AAQ3WDM3_PASNO
MATFVVPCSCTSQKQGGHECSNMRERAKLGRGDLCDTRGHGQASRRGGVVSVHGCDEAHGHELVLRRGEQARDIGGLCSNEIEISAVAFCADLSLRSRRRATYRWCRATAGQETKYTVCVRGHSTATTAMGNKGSRFLQNRFSDAKAGYKQFMAHRRERPGLVVRGTASHARGCEGIMYVEERRHEGTVHRQFKGA